MVQPGESRVDKRSWSELFPVAQPILAMLHLGGDNQEDRLARALSEAEVFREGGVDAVIVENYFGSASDVQRVLDALTDGGYPGAIGINVLGDTDFAFDLAAQYPVDFIQIDSVCGHLDPQNDVEFAAQLAERRAQSSALLFGGVRFKYQPVESGRTEAEDLVLGAERVDAIVVTGVATGAVTDVEKIKRFRASLPATTPLIIGAGVTATNFAEQSEHADAAIVGSFFKEGYYAEGMVDPDHVAELMGAVGRIRQSL